MNRFAQALLPFVLVVSAFAFQGDSPTLERARQRWEHLSPQDQARFRDRYEHYRSLSEDERRMLTERADRMREAKERYRTEMAPELRAKLEHLEPKQRETVLNELVENAARERGARIREKMPVAWVDRFERAKPEDRGRFLADFQQRAREQAARGAIDKIGKKLGLAAVEVDRLKNLPGPERTTAVLELGKTLSVKDVAEFGLPPGLTEAQWAEWRALPPNEFFEVVQRYRREHGWCGTGPGRDGEPRGEPGKGGPPPMPHPLMEALRSTPEEILQYGELPAQERRARLFEHRRCRVIQVVRESKKVDEAVLQEWSRMSEPEFFKALRKQYQRSNDRRGGMRDGTGGSPPDMRDHDGTPQGAHDHGRGGTPPDGRQEEPPDDRFGPGQGEHRGPPPNDGSGAPPCEAPHAPTPKS